MQKQAHLSCRAEQCREEGAYQQCWNDRCSAALHRCEQLRRRLELQAGGDVGERQVQLELHGSLPVLSW